MGLQMRFLGIIESFEQRTLVDRWTGITDIGYMESDGTDFFYEVRALLVAPTDPAINPIATFPGAVFTAKGRRFNLAGFPIEDIPDISGYMKRINETRVSDFL